MVHVLSLTRTQANPTFKPLCNHRNGLDVVNKRKKAGESIWSPIWLMCFLEKERERERERERE